jgi:hypothetical protein
VQLSLTKLNKEKVFLREKFSHYNEKMKAHENILKQKSFPTNTVEKGEKSLWKEKLSNTAASTRSESFS